VVVVVVGGTVVAVDSTGADATVVDGSDVTTVWDLVPPGATAQATKAPSRTVATTNGSRRFSSRSLRFGEWMRPGMSPSG